MARQPFFGRGPGPAIARMDMNVATAPGRAYGQMFANLGKIAGDSIEKYAEGKKKKEEQKQTASFIKRALMNSPETAAQFGITATDSVTFEEAVDQSSNAIAKDPKGLETVKGFVEMANERLKAQQDKELFKLRKEQYETSAEDRERLLKEAEERKLADNQFIGKIMGSSSVPTGQLNEAGQDELERGSLFIAPTKEAVSDFKATLLQDPSTQTKVPMMDLSGNQFIREFSGDSPEVQRRVLNFMQARQKDAPKPMTPEQLLDYQIKLNKERRDQAKEEREASEFEEENKPLPPADSKYAEATLTAVNDALDFLTDGTKKFFSTGVIGQALSNVAGTDAASLRAKLDTIKSGVGFKRLSDMREASKTGGALGNVSDNELRQLNASVGSLDPNQKPSELKKTLETIKEQYESTVKVLKAEKYAYDNGLIFKTPKEAMDFVDNFNASSPQQPTPQSRDELLKQEADLQRRLNERLLNNPPVQQFRGI